VENQRSLIKFIIQIIWASSAIYAILYFFLNAWYSASFLAAGALVVVPLIYYHRNKLPTAALSFLIVFSANLLIFFPSYFNNHQIDAEFFYLVTIQLPFVINLKARKNYASIFFGFSFPIMLWALSNIFSVPSLPFSDLKNLNYIKPIASLNFIFSSLANLFILFKLFQYVEKLNQDKIKLVMQKNSDYQKALQNQTQLNSQLLEQKTFLDAVIQNVPSMIFVKNYKKQLTFSMLNKTGEEIIGTKESELIGKNDYNFFSKKEADFFTQKDKEVFTSRNATLIPQEKITSKNKTLILRTRKVPTFDKDGNPDLLIGISEDITDEVKVQEQLQQERHKLIQASKMSTLGEMAAGVAHEINNPLSIISGNLEILASKNKFDNPSNEKINSIKKNIERISKIVNGLKKFSRSSQTTVTSICSINHIINECTNLVRSKLEKHEIQLELDLLENLYINCNELEIEQVLINLLVNAVDAIKDLESEKWLKVCSKKIGNSIKIQIVDSGKEIDLSISDKIFQPFFTTKSVGEGTGLGLSITKGIIESHNGTITLTKLNENTCFEITLPAAEQELKKVPA
jgi:PAS domain S-box-containing protein